MLEEQGLSCQNCRRSVHRDCYNKDLARCALNKKVEVEGAAIASAEFNTSHKYSNHSKTQKINSKILNDTNS